jgi:ABC-type antimicrobial peptide transport system permease subunit
MLRGAISLTIIGIALGTLGALALGKLLAGWLYGVSPFDPGVYAAVVMGVAALALIAGWLPARRAAAVDPAVALRED